MTMSDKISYLGDGLYCLFDGYQIELRANDPKKPTDRVFLDPYVMNALMLYIEQCKAIIAENEPI